MFGRDFSKAVSRFAVLYYLVFKVGVVLLGIASHFKFAVQLLDAYQDPSIGDRKVLFSWLVVAFVSSAFLTAIVLVTFILMRIERLRVGSFVKYCNSVSPLATAAYPDQVSVLLGVLTLLGSDVIFVFMTANTLGFLGFVNPWWSFLLVFSVASTSYRLASFLALRTFGLLSVVAKVGIQVAYICSFFLFISLGVTTRFRTAFASWIGL